MAEVKDEAMKDNELIAFAAEFRDGILEGRPSIGMCFAISSPLAALLGLYGVECCIDRWEDGEGNHYWIRLADGRVLDATADQCGLAPVYLGPPVDGVHEIADMAEVRG